MHFYTGNFEASSAWIRLAYSRRILLRGLPRRAAMDCRKAFSALVTRTGEFILLQKEKPPVISRGPGLRERENLLTRRHKETGALCYIFELLSIGWFLAPKTKTEARWLRPGQTEPIRGNKSALGDISPQSSSVI